MNYLNLSILAGLLAVFYGLFQSWRILKLPKGTPDMNAIADAISEGAASYMKKQCQSLSILIRKHIICALMH